MSLAPALLPDRAPAPAAYQPIVDLHQGTVAGYAGQPGPGPRALTPAEHLGAVLARLDDLPRGRFLSVDVEPVTLVWAAATDVLDRRRDLHGLVLELTERSPIAPGLQVDVRRCLDRLRSRGARLALAHAGSGYAGLSRILDLQPSILKIDRLLVQGIDGDEAKRVLVEMLTRYAWHLDALVLADGIETLTELRALRHLGVSLGQGPVLAPSAGRWSSLRPEASAVLTAPPAEPLATAAVLVEQAATVAAGDPPPPPGEYALVLGGRGEPVGAWTATAERPGEPAPVLTVSPTLAVTDLARLALARPVPHRFEPVACTDPAGRVMGVVRMERVLELLARRGRARKGSLAA